MFHENAARQIFRFFPGGHARVEIIHINNGININQTKLIITKKSTFFYHDKIKKLNILPFYLKLQYMVHSEQFSLCLVALMKTRRGRPR